MLDPAAVEVGGDTRTTGGGGGAAIGRTEAILLLRFYERRTHPGKESALADFRGGGAEAGGQAVEKVAADAGSVRNPGRCWWGLIAASVVVGAPHLAAAPGGGQGECGGGGGSEGNCGRVGAGEGGGGRCGGSGGDRGDGGDGGGGKALGGGAGSLRLRQAWEWCMWRRCRGVASGGGEQSVGRRRCWGVTGAGGAVANLSFSSVEKRFAWRGMIR